MSMKKYRPYFTLEELKHVHQSVSDFMLKRYIGRFIEDIDQGYRSANIVVGDSQAVKVGFAKADQETSFEKEQERRFLNNEMTEQEEKEYQLSIGIPLNTSIPQG